MAAHFSRVATSLAIFDIFGSNNISIPSFIVFGAVPSAIVKFFSRAAFEMYLSLANFIAILSGGPKILRCTKVSHRAGAPNLLIDPHLAIPIPTGQSLGFIKESSHLDRLLCPLDVQILHNSRGQKIHVEDNMILMSYLKIRVHWGQGFCGTWESMTPVFFARIHFIGLVLVR